MNKEKLAYSEGWISIFVNIILFGIKYWAGVVSGSIALIGDAWHSLTDSISSVAVIIGTKVSSKPPDKKHPFGHGRAELISSIIIGALLAMVAFNFLTESINSIKNKEEAVFGNLALIIIIVSIVIKEISAQYAFYTARKTGMLSLKADGWHHRSDAITSVLILIGIFINPYFPLIDGILGIIISFFIFYTAYEITKQTADAILGESCDENTVNELKKIANNIAGFDIQMHHVHIHNYINHSEVTFHIYLPDKMTVSDSHTITSKIISKIKEEKKITATIYIDPIKEIN
ncbi:MAG: cation diffusion facilitator family transporter [Bacteroidales bacterium]|nr:cation diffusion facilitator family transporter [Bacteroidales bacterium]